MSDFFGDFYGYDFGQDGASAAPAGAAPAGAAPAGGGGGGGGAAGAAGAVLQGAAAVVNAITGAVSEGVRQQNEPHIYARNQKNLWNKRLPQVRKLNERLSAKKSARRRKLAERVKIKRDSAKLKKDLKKELAGLKKWPNGAYIDGIRADVLKNRIKSIDNNGVMISKDARYNHLWHGPGQIKQLDREINLNINHSRRQDLKKAWGYLTNIVAFSPFLKSDTSGMGMAVLQNIPARDDLIGKVTLQTVFPAGDGSADANVGQVPIWQRSEILGSWLNYYADGHIPGSYFPPMWIYGLTAEEARELDPGAPIGALYELAMVNFPGQFRPTFHTGSPMTYVSGDGYDSLGYDAMGSSSNLLGKITEAMRSPGGLQSVIDQYSAKLQSGNAPPPHPQEVVASLPDTPANQAAVQQGTNEAGVLTYGQLPPQQNNIEKLQKQPLSERLGFSPWLIGVPVGLAAVGGLIWALRSR